MWKKTEIPGSQKPVFMGMGKMDEKDYNKLKEALGWLETFLGDAPYMAGDRMTIADFSLTATISSIDVCPKSKP